MALIKCKECENEYSDKAKECPKCGCPTINNTISEKRKNIPECSVEIKGDEKYHPSKGLKVFRAMIEYTIISVLIFTTIGSSIILLLIFSFPYIYIRIYPSLRKEAKQHEAINEYFQNRFPLLDSLPNGYSETKVINTVEGDQISLMFDVYMEAYKFNADAIVINNSNVSTHVSGSTSANIITKGSSGKTTSSNKFHITATLVRY